MSEPITVVFFEEDKKEIMSKASTISELHEWIEQNVHEHDRGIVGLVAHANGKFGTLNIRTGTLIGGGSGTALADRSGTWKVAI